MSLKWDSHELSRESIDLISEQIRDFYNRVGVDRRTVYRTCLTTEEILIHILEHYEEEITVEIGIGKQFGRQVLRIRYEEASFDPVEENEDDWSNRILSSLGVLPVWSFRGRVNQVSMTVEERRKLGTLFWVVNAVILAILTGLLGHLMPEEYRIALETVVLTPVMKAFLGLLNTFAGFMIAFTVCSGILGMGDAATLREVGKGFMIRIVLFTMAAASFGAVLVQPFVHLNTGVGSQSGFSQVESVTGMLFNILPSDSINPFLTGNSLQIIVIAIMIGVTLLILGERGKNLQIFVNEGAVLLQNVMSTVCGLFPLFVYMALLRHFWSGDILMIVSIWKPVVLAIVLNALLAILSLVITAVQTKCPLGYLTGTVLTPFLVAFSTASSIMAMPHSMDAGENKLGIDHSFLKFTYPIGNVMYMPAVSLSLTVFTVYFAQEYGVEVSQVWFILAVITSSLLAIALPPLPGVGLMLYTTMFAQMGIPSDAILLASLMELVIEYVNTGGNVLMLLLELTREAAQMNRLDRSAWGKNGDFIERS
ncbi:MAG: cation:dicarboxylase symporter family transporter [Bacillota bacterium]|nr:cation:dicarboxylase symporter family transporter [Bacillota bacterium]